VTPDDIAVRLGVSAWPQHDRERGLAAARLAHDAFAGVVRDQGTPYIEHPVAVAVIVRDEAGLDDSEDLIVALLHDAFEVNRDTEAGIRAALGDPVADAVRQLTPEHRLAGRLRQDDDDAAYHRKIAALDDRLLVIKLADRLHNLRDLPASTNPDRSARFLDQLDAFYLPLARQRRHPGVAALTAALERARTQTTT
jgi:(p)ppGpp synthase/HD superfamily hydrolase